jgi:hypothetical protein
LQSTCPDEQLLPLLLPQAAINTPKPESKDNPIGVFFMRGRIVVEALLVKNIPLPRHAHVGFLTLHIGRWPRFLLDSGLRFAN